MDPIKKTALGLIKIYQKTLSPDHGVVKQIRRSPGACKFYPTCSEYMYQAIERHGLVRGIRLGFARIGRCHPWSAGGIDEVPSKNFITF